MTIAEVPVDGSEVTMYHGTEFAETPIEPEVKEESISDNLTDQFSLKSP